MLENLKELKKEWEAWNNLILTAPTYLIQKEKRSIATAVRLYCEKQETLTAEEKQFFQETEYFLEKTS